MNAMTVGEYIDVLMAPLDDCRGKMSILPVYLIAGLFIYHLSMFKDVRRSALSCSATAPIDHPAPCKNRKGKVA